MTVFAVIAQSNPDAVKAAIQTNYGTNFYEFAA